MLEDSEFNAYDAVNAYELEIEFSLQLLVIGYVDPVANHNWLKYDAVVANDDDMELDANDELKDDVEYPDCDV